jgi:hypothetical protein
MRHRKVKKLNKCHLNDTGPEITVQVSETGSLGSVPRIFEQFTKEITCFLLAEKGTLCY